MTTGYLAAQTPQINIPFLNPDGTVSQVWLLFLIQLFQRTGGSTSPTYTLAEIEKLALLNLSVVNANGFNGIVTSGQNATLTIETTVTGIVKGNGTALSAATPGVDYSIIDSIAVTVPPALLSVTPSSLSSSGTFAINLTTQASNTLFAGPITGVATTPTFRGLVSTDIPALNYVSTLTTQGANQILAGPSSGVGAPPTFRSLTTADIPALPYGSGTVTSVGMSVPASLLSVAPSTITTTGTFALSLTTQTPAQIFASPISTVGTPSFRSLVTSDIPALNYVSSTTTQAAQQILAGPITGTSAPTFRSLVSTDIPALPYGTGTVTSVGLALPNIMSVSGSPVTTTGTLTGTLTTQAANSLFAGPISGVGATPTFRALTTADIAGLGVGTVTSVGMTVPSILSVTPSTITTSGSFALSLTTESANQIFAGPSSGAAAIPTFRSLTSADIPALPYGTGTVTSVGLSLPSIFNVTGSPVTTSGTLSATLATETANYVFAGPTTGSAAAPTFRALVANDIPSLPYVTSVSQSFTGGLISTSGSPITSSGTLALTVAGTSGGIPYFSSGTTWASSAALAANALMIGGGAGVSPSTTTTGTGVLTALGTSVGTSGSFVTNGGALGTPSSGTVTNLTGTAAINITGTAPAGTLTGTTLNSTVVTSSLTSVGTIGTGTWQGTKIGTGYGGTGLTSFTANGVVYASSTSALATSSTFTFNSSGQLQVNTAGQPSLLLTNTTVTGGSTSGTTGLYLGDTGSGVNVLTREKVTNNTAYARIYAEQGYNTASLCASFYNTVAYQGNNSTAWAITSDERVKTNIRPIGNALEKICSLNAVHFEYKNAIGKIKTSFIAQEVETVLPGHVHEIPAPDDLKQYVDEDGMMKALDSDLIPYLVAAMKELSLQVTTLQATVTTLQAKAT